MNVERTMQFILQSQAKAEIRMQKTDARVDVMERRLDKRMDGITKLLQQGMRILVKVDTKLAELAEAQKELAEAQKQTDRNLQALIKSLRNGRL